MSAPIDEGVFPMSNPPASCRYCSPASNATARPFDLVDGAKCIENRNVAHVKLERQVQKGVVRQASKSPPVAIYVKSRV